MAAPDAPNVRYRAPADRAAKPCPLAAVFAAIHGRDAGYWSEGDGVAALHDRRGGTLTLAFKPEHGFFLTAYRTDGDPASHVASTNADYDETVDLRVGAKTVTVPRAFFVPPLRAIQVVEQFARDGSRSKAVNWISMPGRPRG